MMRKTITYLGFTLILAMGIMACLHGSRLIVKTYQRERIYTEAVVLGRMPVKEHLQSAEKKGLKDALADLCLQLGGGGAAIVGLSFLIRTSRK